MLLGILAGLATCALWGLSFVAPRAVEPFTALDLTIARYGIFGLVSALLMILPRFRPKGLSCGQWLRGMLLGGAGYIGYFIAVAHAVRLAGASAVPTPNIKDRTVTLPQTYIGVDVAKDWIDVCDTAASRQERIPTDRRSLRRFAASTLR